jgi:hypothetical protein
LAHATTPNAGALARGGTVSAPGILISGASIAGPALAWWLARYGWSVTLVERFDGPREGGHNVDVRGAAREVLRRMDLEDAVRAAGTGERGLAFVDDRGRRLAELPAGTGDADGATAELEILRGDLAGLLVDRTRDGVEYVFGERISTLDDRDGRVRVGFANGADREFDVVVVAEGLAPRTWELVLPGARITDLGVHVAYLSYPRTRTGLRAQRAAVRIAGHPVCRRLGAPALRRLGPPADAIELPPPREVPQGSRRTPEHTTTGAELVVTPAGRRASGGRRHLRGRTRRGRS